MTIQHIADVIHSKGDHLYVGLGLLLAGFIPMSLISSQTLQAIYFILLIPPAAYHCYVCIKKYFFPPIIEVVKPIIKPIIKPIVTVLPVVKQTLVSRIRKLFNR